jgi:chloramphenicol 3-O phosphotransferase
MSGPTIIFLNGTSSSGKTSIARALQATLEEPYLYFSADIRKPMLPPYREGRGWSVADILGKLRHGYYGCIATLSGFGNYVIADQAVERPEWMVQCAEALLHTRTFLIGVRCPREVAESRERERADRTLGLVNEQFDVVHQLGVYDIEVDSSALTPEECAERIKAYVSSHEPAALKQIVDLKAT